MVVPFNTVCKSPVNTVQNVNALKNWEEEKLLTDNTHKSHKLVLTVVIISHKNKLSLELLSLCKLGEKMVV